MRAREVVYGIAERDMVLQNGFRRLGTGDPYRMGSDSFQSTKTISTASKNLRQTRSAVGGRPASVCSPGLILSTL